MSLINNHVPDRLVPSPADVVHGAFEVEERFLELCAAYLRIRGVELPIPPELDRDMIRWRQMRVRHKCQSCLKARRKGTLVIRIGGQACCGLCGRQGDYRHTDAELKSLKAIAQWTLEVNAALRNQTPPKVEL